MTHGTPVSASETPPDRVLSGLGGSGAGTGLAGLGLFGAGTDTAVGQVLVLLSPAFSVVAGSLLYYLQMELNRRLEVRAAARARRTLIQAIENENLPPDKREHFKEQLATFEEGVIAREMDRVAALGLVPPRDGR